MHLYLSSFLLGSRSHDLLALMRSPTVLVIANALDHAKGNIRTSYLNGEIDAFRRLGVDAHELDLRDHFNAPDALSVRLDTAGLVWVTGGNVFLLRRAMQQSAFDTYIVANAHSDRLVYGGFSAGACVAGPTLRGYELVDDLRATSGGYADHIIWDGLGLVPYSIAPHFNSDHEDSARVACLVDYFVEHGLPFITLRDGEAVIAVAGT